MKANEFIKKNGIEAAKKILSFRGGFRGFITLTDGSALHSDELRELVESHELVESLGGFKKAKERLNHLCILRWITPEILELQSAINDVESCGGERG